MKHVIFWFLFFPITNYTFSQDSCQIDEKIYFEKTDLINEFFHDNGVPSHKYITKSENRYTHVEWDNCGRFVQKIKSRKVRNKKISYYKITRIEYIGDDRIKLKGRSKIRGCKHVRKSSRKRYSENGKRFKKSKSSNFVTFYA